jgi:hypothetical protein
MGEVEYEEEDADDEEEEYEEREVEYEEEEEDIRKEEVDEEEGEEERAEEEEGNGRRPENLRSTACTLRMYARLNSSATGPCQNVFCPVTLYQFAAAVNVFGRL